LSVACRGKKKFGKYVYHNVEHSVAIAFLAVLTLYAMMALRKVKCITWPYGSKSEVGDKFW
jgi:hypothetical protein